MAHDAALLSSSAQARKEKAQPKAVGLYELVVAKKRDHLPAHQAVGLEAVRFAGFLGVRLRLALAPLKTEPPATVIKSTNTVS
jgi:hypothetical protein